MNDNLFQVTKDGKSGFINDKGQVVIDLIFSGVLSVSEGFVRIFVDGKVGFIDKKGTLKFNPSLTLLQTFQRALHTRQRGTNTAT
jgi:hypothetical protein